MKKAILFFSILFFTNAVLFAQQTISKSEAKSRISEMAKKNDVYKEMLNEINNYTEKATHNHKDIVQLSEYAVKYGLDIKFTIKLAEIYSECNFENQFFASINELACLLNKPDENLYALAKKTAMAQHDADIRDLKLKITEMAKNAPYKSLEEVPEKK